MYGGRIFRAIATATLVCGTLDMLWAVILTLWRGREPAAMLRFVASGLVPPAADWGTAGSFLGLTVHFALMAVMVGVFVIAAQSRRHLIDMPVRAAVAYGIVTYVVMNLVVVPLRFPEAWPPKPLSITTQLFAHIVLLALPTALITRRFVRG